MLQSFLSINRQFRLTIIHSTMTLVPLILSLLFSLPVSSQPTEQQVKGVAIEKLAIFIQWPASAEPDERQEFVIAVYNHEKFAETLKEIYRNHSIKSRKVRVVSFTDARKIPDCHVLFIPEVKKNTLNEILERASKMPVLTVADTEGFAEQGCCVNFYMDDGKLRFEINQSQVNALGFEVDYKLLNIARLVKSSGGH